MDLSGKIVAITGGGGGIGRVAVRRFAAYGAQVIILELNKAQGREAQAEIEAAGGKALFIHTDISSEESVKAAFAVIAERFGRLDVLYNNASVFLGGRDTVLDELPSAIWKKVQSINLDGLFYCSQNALHLMKAHGGSIINTASSAGVIGIPDCDAYTATKGGIVSLTRSMAVEYGPDGVRVNCIAPAAIRTDMVRESNLDDPNFDEQFFLTKGTPLRRWGKPEEVAELACFLASDRSAYLNGDIIRADGGITVM